MSADNLQRMIRLADEFFGAKGDPDQLSIDEEVIDRLKKLHPATMSEERNEGGPIAWVLVIPTTRPVMELFLAGGINERQLLDMTAPGGRYEAIYLCSALVLPEFRGRGIARSLTLNAISSIRKDHAIEAIFVWEFSKEGQALAEKVAADSGVPLFRRGTR